MLKYSSIVALSLIILFSAFGGPLFAQTPQLPVRETAIPKTTNSVPHVQLGVQVDPDLAAKFLGRVASLPDVEVRETVVSLPGAKGFWLNDALVLARPDVIVGGREFAHMHPDGSLHASLRPATARAAVKTGWATPHPWANQRPGWEGFVMVYTPMNDKELEVVFSLVVDSYEFVTGRRVIYQ